MKSKANKEAGETGAGKVTNRIVSEELDKMQAEMEEALNKEVRDDNRKSQVRLIRSRRETRIVTILRGDLQETEDRLQRIYKAITG
jgi:hypothetical protein